MFNLNHFYFYVFFFQPSLNNTAVLVYLNSLHGEFILDDIWSIKNNPDVDPSKSTLADLFEHNSFGALYAHHQQQHAHQHCYRPAHEGTRRNAPGTMSLL